MAVKAINNTACFNRLVPTLLVYKCHGTNLTRYGSACECTRIHEYGLDP
jgi:hypothetical protein